MENLVTQFIVWIYKIMNGLFYLIRIFKIKIVHAHFLEVVQVLLCTKIICIYLEVRLIKIKNLMIYGDLI